MPSYMLVTYQSDKGPRAGIAVDDKLFDAAALTRKAGYSSVLAILSEWSSAKGALKKAAAAAGKSKLKSKPLAAPGCLRRCSGRPRSIARAPTTPTT